MKKRIALGVGLLIVLWLVVAGVLGATAYSSARKGQKTLTAVSHGDITALRAGGQDQNLTAAAAQLMKAHNRLSNPLLMPARAIPFVGRQLQSARALTKAGSKTSSIALDTLVQVRPLADNAKADRAGSLAKISVVLKNSDAQLRTIDLGPKQHLYGPIKNARIKAVDELNTVDHGLVEGGAASDGLGKLLTTNSTYLLIAANNAEMRNGSGMFLQAGTLTTGNGKLTVSNMQTVGKVNVADGKVAWPADIEANWGFLGHQGYMQNLMLSPRFDVNAPIAEDIWAQAGKGKVDGVITMDVAMMQALIATTGPVSADGKTLTGDNVEQELLLDQYAGLSSAASNDARRDVLSDVAAVAFDKFNTGGWDIAAAAKQIGKAAEGRHLMMYSEDPALNADWVVAGVGGVVAPNDTSVSIANLGTNKLDQFMKVDSTMSTTKTSSSVNVTVTIKVSNSAPATGSPYVLGPTVNSQLQAGEYAGALSLSLPDDATGLKFDGSLPLTFDAHDGTNVAAAVAIDVLSGNSQTFVLHYLEPAQTTGTFVIPSARIPGVTWHYHSESWTDDHTHRITY